jgi:lipopolysaccharide export system ATP-binding protein
MSGKLSVQHLAKSFRRRQVVQDVSFELNSGEVVGLLGPNGAGKTTSFYIVVGLISGGGGTITLNDQDITDFPMHTRARLGLSYLPQEPSVFRKLTVEQNVLAILELQNKFDRNAIRQRSLELLEELGIAHLSDIMAMSLSGGERRRLEIARALAVNPYFMLLDEPFAGIDPIAVSEIKRIIVQLRERNIGILITDHNVRETLDICDRAYIISAGHVIAHGDPEYLLGHSDVREVYLGEHFSMK